MLSTIKSAFLEASGQGDKPLGKTAQNALLRRKFVTDFLKSNDCIQNANVCAGLGVSSATANRLLSEMCREGALAKVRKGKYWSYIAASVE